MRKQKDVGPSMIFHEMAVIKSVVCDNSLYDVSGLSVEDFSGRETTLAWKVIEANRKSGKMSITVPYLESAMQEMGMNPLLFVSELRTTAYKENDFMNHVRALRSASFGRSILEMKDDIDILSKSGDDPETISTHLMDIIDTKLSNVCSVSDDDDSFEAFEKAMMERRDNPATTTRVPTGYGIIDRAFNGGIPPGMHVIGALPSVGKTSFSVQMALQMAMMGHRVCFLSMEMTADIFYQQCISIISSTKRFQVEAQVFNNDEEMRRHDHAMKVLKRLKETTLYVDFKERHTPMTAEAAIYKAQRKIGKVDVVFVDYLQYMDPPSGKYFSEAEKYKEVSKCLRDMAKKHVIPFICLSQLNREIERDQVPSMQNLAGTSQIERDVDICMMLYIKKHRSAFGSGHEALREVIGLEVVKGRSSGTYSFELDFVPVMTRFSTNFNFMAEYDGEKIRAKLDPNDINAGCVSEFINTDAKEAAKAPSSVYTVDEDPFEFNGFL